VEILTAAMRLEWAKAEAKRKPSTQALTRFIKDSLEEYSRLKLKLGNVEKAIKLERLSGELKI
jgi:hypothetical protein